MVIVEEEVFSKLVKRLKSQSLLSGNWQLGPGEVRVVVLELALEAWGKPGQKCLKKNHLVKSRGFECGWLLTESCGFLSLDGPTSTGQLNMCSESQRQFCRACKFKIIIILGENFPGGILAW